MSITKKAFRRNLRPCVEMKEELAARLLRTGHPKIGWVRKKRELTRCYRCQGFGNFAETCIGPNRARVC